MYADDTYTKDGQTLFNGSQQTSIMDLNATLNLLTKLKVFEITTASTFITPTYLESSGLLNKVDMN